MNSEFEFLSMRWLHMALPTYSIHCILIVKGPYLARLHPIFSSLGLILCQCQKFHEDEQIYKVLGVIFKPQV